MSDLRNGDWSWFEKLLVPLQARSRHDVHPPRSVLLAYMRGWLRDLWRVGQRPLDPDNWTLTEVSQHVLTCQECAQQLTLLRHGALKPSLWTELKHALPKEIQAHLVVYALALLALLGLNALLVFVVPAPTVLGPCFALGERSGPARPADPEFPEGLLKFEGFNKSARCVPVPASRPLWQTWWIGWIFLLWTILLGLRILWEWVASPASRRLWPQAQSRWCLPG